MLHGYHFEANSFLFVLFYREIVRYLHWCDSSHWIEICRCSSILRPFLFFRTGAPQALSVLSNALTRYLVLVTSAHVQYADFLLAQADLDSLHATSPHASMSQVQTPTTLLCQGRRPISPYRQQCQET